MFRTKKEIANLIRVLCDVYEKDTPIKLICESRNNTKEFTGNLLGFSTDKITIQKNRKVTIDINSVTEVQAITKDLDKKLAKYLPCEIYVTYKQGLGYDPDELELKMELYTVVGSKLIVVHSDKTQPAFLDIKDVAKLKIEGMEIDLCDTVFKDGKIVKKEPKLTDEYYLSVDDDDTWEKEEFAEYYYADKAKDLVDDLNDGDLVEVLYTVIKTVGGCRAKSRSSIRGIVKRVEPQKLVLDTLQGKVSLFINSIENVTVIKEGMR